MKTEAKFNHEASNVFEACGQDKDTVMDIVLNVNVFQSRSKRVEDIIKSSSSIEEAALVGFFVGTRIKQLKEFGMM